MTKERLLQRIKNYEFVLRYYCLQMEFLSFDKFNNSSTLDKLRHLLFKVVFHSSRHV